MVGQIVVFSLPPPIFATRILVEVVVNHIPYNSTNTQIPPLAAVSAFTSLPLPTVRLRLSAEDG